MVPKNEEIRSLELNGQVGFNSLPHQVVRKFVSQGFCFNILCIGMSKHDVMNNHQLNWMKSSSFAVFLQGETGIGKSTLINTLFNTTFENEEADHYEQEVKLRSQTYELQEHTVKLKLTVVHTVGFGDQINKEERWRTSLDVGTLSKTGCCPDDEIANLTSASQIDLEYKAVNNFFNCWTLKVNYSIFYLYILLGFFFYKKKKSTIVNKK